MSQKNTSPESCQVDFYLLAASSTEAGELACRLALMAWEQKQKTFVITATSAASNDLTRLMWQFPEGRFLPHAGADEAGFDKAPVKIGTISSLNPTDVVINLCPEAVPQPERFSRILEIVPFAEDKKEASRMKYKTYRKLGFNPQTHEIGTPSRNTKK